MGGVLLYRDGYRAGGALLGVSGAVMGIGGVLSSFYGVYGSLHRYLWIAFSFSAVGSLYLEFKTPRVLLISIFPLFFLIQTFLPSLPFIVAFAGLALVVAVFNAYDFCRLDVAACMEHAGRRLRVVLVPFSRAENLSRQIVRKRSRPLLFALHFSLSAVLVAIPVLVYLASDRSIWFDVLPLISLAYLSEAGLQCAKGLAGLKGSSQYPS